MAGSGGVPTEIGSGGGPLLFLNCGADVGSGGGPDFPFCWGSGGGGIDKTPSLWNHEGNVITTNGDELPRYWPSLSTTLPLPLLLALVVSSASHLPDGCGRTA